MSKLPEIPSDFIEPYLVKYVGYIIDCIGNGCKTPEEAKQDLLGVERFVSMFGGIHSRLACTNQYYMIINMPDDALLELCQKTVKESVADAEDYY
jgi:hypothetical protein